MSDEPREVTLLIDGPKVTAYLLDLRHARGGSKARYLMRFGFTLAEPQVLAEALAAHAVANAPGVVQHQPAGPNRIRFEGFVRAPDGRDMPLATVWEAIETNGEAQMRFITAVPLTR